MSDLISTFREAVAKSGLTITGEIVADGKIHRFKNGEDKHANSYYILHNDEHPVGVYGCHKRDVKYTWQAENGSYDSLSPEEKRKMQDRWREAEAARARDEADQWERVSVGLTDRVKKLKKATYSHDYLRKKAVTTYGNLLEDEDGPLFLPLQDAAGKIWSCQRIYPDGLKRYASGGKKEGCFYWIADRLDGPLIICEGYATGASIHQATGWAVACAMDAGNLAPVAKALREKHPDRAFLLAADNDRWDKKTGELRSTNPGLDAATQAAKECNGVVVFPVFPESDKTSTDFNDLALSAGLEAVQALFEQAVPCPLSILSFDQISLIPVSDQDRLIGDNMLNRGGNMTILGQGGVGKTRVVLQMIAACHMGMPKFMTWDIHPGARNFRWLVLQHENSVRRLQATRQSLKACMSPVQWMKFNDSVRILTPLNETDCFLNLDNPDNIGRIQKAIDHHLPDGLIFDSLYDFSSGDLNKDADMRATLTSISRLTRYRNPKRACIVLHHASPGQSGASKAVGFDRATFARNSKVIQFWSRCQVNIIPMSEDDNTQLAISCGKLSDGKEFPPFAVNLNETSLLYEIDSEVDVAEWSRNIKKGSNEPEITPDGVMMLTQPAMTKKDLADKIQEQIGCSKMSSYRHIKRAEQKGKIKLTDGRYFKA